jgi:hypothetical protein
LLSNAAWRNPNRLSKVVSGRLRILYVARHPGNL